MPRALKPPPYERSNWDSMNEGQRRYAMEQWQLARVRRGERFEAPGEGEDNWYLDNFNIDVLGNPQEPEVSSSQDETNAIDDFLQQVENNQMADAVRSDAVRKFFVHRVNNCFNFSLNCGRRGLWFKIIHQIPG